MFVKSEVSTYWNSIYLLDAGGKQAVFKVTPRVLAGQLGAMTPNAVARCRPLVATRAQAASLFPAEDWVRTPRGEHDEQETTKHVELISSSELSFSH